MGYVTKVIGWIECATITSERYRDDSREEGIVSQLEEILSQVHGGSNR